MASKNIDNKSYHRTQMQKDIIIKSLKDRGCRVTKQRLMLLDIILEEECSCCKEIYYRAIKDNPNIGTATVYRMINTLEEIGAISRKNMYKIACGRECEKMNACTIELKDGKIIDLSANQWNQVILAGLKQSGYGEDLEIESVSVRTCDCDECGCGA